MAGTIQEFAKMTSGGKYFERQIEYYEKQFIQEARKQFPEHTNLTDSELLKNKDVIEALKDNPYAPRWSGSLASTFGIEGSIVELESWTKACAGYVPNTDLLNNAEKLNSNAFKVEVNIDANGNPEAKLVEKEGYRVATEIIFGNSKEYSVLCAMTEGKQHQELMELKNRVLEQVMKAMEDDIYVRKTKNGVSTKEKGYGLMYVAYHHIENRGASEDHNHTQHTTVDNTTNKPLHNKAEPYDHTHLTLMNSTRDKEGNLCALDNDLILKNKPHYNALYSSLMTEGLRELGYEMVPKYAKDQVDNEYMEDTEKGLLTMVPKIPQDLVDFFSQRSNQVKAEGGDNNKLKKIAQSTNKNSKTEETNSELQERWKFEAEAIDSKYTSEFFKDLQKPELSKTFVNEETLKELTSKENWDRKLVDSFYDHHKEIACSEAQVKSFLFLKIHQYTDKETAERMAEEIFSKQFVAVLDKETELEIQQLTEKPEGLTIQEAENLQIELKQNLKFIDQKRIEEEKKMVESFYKRADETQFMLKPEDVEKIILEVEKEQGYKMNEQQRQTVINQTTLAGAYALLSGRAGSGKSTSSKATVRAFEKAGFKVIGIGSANKNMKGLLAETGIKEGYNTEKLLKKILNGKLQLDSKTILICDEMAMADGYTWTRLVSEIDKAGACAKFLGEGEQLKTVGASGGFELLRSLNLNNSKLTIINRQKLDWMKEATEQFASGKGDVALKKYYDEGKINIKAKTLKEANVIAVDKYFEVPEFDKNGKPISKLIITDTNENVSTINDQVKLKLVEQGKITEDKVQITTKKFGSRGMAEGDKITFKENLNFLEDGKVKQKASKAKPAFSILNGDEATVKFIDTEKKLMTVEMSTGELRTVRTDQKFDINHSYCITVHSSQGASINNVFFVPTNTSDLSKIYVAGSRHKDDMLIIFNDELKDKMAKETKNIKPTKQMVDFIDGLSKKHKLEVEPNVRESFTKAREFLNEYAYLVEGKKAEKHPMDEYSNFLLASTKEQTKKTTMDYQTIDQSIMNFVKEGVQGLKKKEEKQETKVVIEQPEQIKARLEEQKKLQAIVTQRDGGVQSLQQISLQQKQEAKANQLQQQLKPKQQQSKGLAM
ncbi:MAG: MobF family relaxase [Flavobacterium sp.]|nr:MobF family relaxase [Flavobacterium sp.]